MNLKGIIKKIFFWTIFVSLLIHSNFGISNAAEFEIEDIITAIKKDIQTVMMTGTGSPNFEIETVKTVLTVVSKVTQIGSLMIKVAGFDHDAPDRTLEQGAYHKLNFTFTPSGTPGPPTGGPIFRASLEAMRSPTSTGLCPPGSACSWLL